MEGDARLLHERIALREGDRVVLRPVPELRGAVDRAGHDGGQVRGDRVDFVGRLAGQVRVAGDVDAVQVFADLARDLLRVGPPGRDAVAGLGEVRRVDA